MNALSPFFFFFVGQSLRRLFTEIRSMMKGVVVGFSQRNVVCVVASFSLYLPPETPSRSGGVFDGTDLVSDAGGMFWPHFYSFSLSFFVFVLFERDFLDVQTLDTMQALCLPLGASVSLLVMFFFFDSMQLLFAVCTASK